MPVSLTPGGQLTVAPAWAEFLREAGIVTADDVMALSGEVVSGHADRHVRKVTLTACGQTRTVYLKREHTRSHRAKWKNWRVGAGWVSRSAHEATILFALGVQQLPGPRLIAVGHDSRGFAFLLVAELVGYRELRQILESGFLSDPERHRFCQQLGNSLAALHQAGFSTPDLAAKHVYADANHQVVLVDWQGSLRANAPVSLRDCLRPLATLHASLSPELATPRERINVLKSYLRARSEQGLAHAARVIDRSAQKRSRRSSVRDQQGGDAVRLVWLAGEAVCVVAEYAPAWPQPVIGPPFYPGPNGGGFDRARTTIDGHEVEAIRFRSRDPFGRLLARIRERPWRSPGAEAGRILVHLARHAIPAPELVGFGQSLNRHARADSFVAYLARPDAVPFSVVLGQGVIDHDSLATMTVSLLRRIHDAGLRLTYHTIARHHFEHADCGVRVATPLALRRAKNLSPRVRQNDLDWLLTTELARLSIAARNRARAIYHHGVSAEELMRGLA